MYSQRKASLLSVFEKYITADIVVLMLLIGYEFIKAVRYAADESCFCRKKVYIDRPPETVDIQLMFIIFCIILISSILLNSKIIFYLSL